MSNSNDTKASPGTDKKDLHPDFEELLKAEQARASSERNKGVEKSNPSASVDLDDLSDLDDEFDDLHDDTEEDGHHDFNKEEESFEKDQTEVTGKEASDNSEFMDLDGGLISSGGDEENPNNLDDSMEFNFDDTSVTSPDKMESNQSAVKKNPIKKSSNLTYYIILIVLVVAGVVFYAVSHRGASKVQNSQQGTGFKPVLPVVHQLPQSLPPAVPQSLQPAETTVMGGSDDQILTGSGQSYPSSSGSVTMLQVNRQELLQLLTNFQKAVDKSGQSTSEEVSALRTSLNSINASDAQLSQNIDARLQQVNTQIESISQKVDSYNHAITGIQSALEQTQQQLKLILAQRAEDIDHYTLRAIVSGRAWLVDGQGQTVTIVAGQELKNYGTVQEINDKMGYVTMSSGFIFK
jgi:hypothetical protein